jgi:hypothetical protein
MLTIIVISAGAGAGVGIFAYYFADALLRRRPPLRVMSARECFTAMGFPSAATSPVIDTGVVPDFFCGAGVPRPTQYARALASMSVDDVIAGQRSFVATWASSSDGQL